MFLVSSEPLSLMYVVFSFVFALSPSLLEFLIFESKVGKCLHAIIFNIPACPALSRSKKQTCLCYVVGVKEMFEDGIVYCSNAGRVSVGLVSVGLLHHICCSS